MEIVDVLQNALAVVGVFFGVGVVAVGSYFWWLKDSQMKGM